MLLIVIRRFKVETGATTFDKCSHILDHVDDVVVMGRRLQEPAKVFTSLVEKTNKVGLEIN